MAAPGSSAEAQPSGGPAHAAVVFVGHHQAGKSTIAGHIIMKLGGLDKRLLDRVERDTSNRPASRYAWVLDRHKLERDRAMSVDLKICRVAAPPGAAAVAAAAGLEAAGGEGGLSLTLLDTPGHPDYLRNTIAAITQADVAVLVVDCRPAVLESASSAAQGRDLALLALNLAANHKTLVVAVNQLDVAYESEAAEARFNEACAVLPKMIRQRKESLVFVPVSGYTGDNLVKAAPARMPWYSGPTLLEAIAAAAATARPAAAAAAAAAAAPGGVAASELPLRLPILNVYKVGGIGTVPVGRVAGGSLRRGGAATLLPGPRSRGLPQQGQQQPQAAPQAAPQASAQVQAQASAQPPQPQQQAGAPAAAPAPAQPAPTSHASAEAAQAAAPPAAGDGVEAGPGGAAAESSSGAGGPSTAVAVAAAAPVATAAAAGSAGASGQGPAPGAAVPPVPASASASTAPVLPIRSIEAFHDSRAAAVAGDFVGVAIRGLPVAALRRGHVLCGGGGGGSGAAGAGGGGGGGGGGGEPACVAASFTARVQVHRDPTSKRPHPSAATPPGMAVGRYVPLVAIHTAQAPCRLLRASKLNTKGEVVEADVKYLREGDIAEVELAPLRPLVVEPFRSYPHLGRFAVRASCRQQMRGVGVITPVVVAVGRVESVNYVRLEDFSPPAAPRDVLAKRTARKARGASGAAGFDDTAAGGAGGEGAAGAGAGEAGERVTIDMSGEAEEGGGPE